MSYQVMINAVKSAQKFKKAKLPIFPEKQCAIAWRLKHIRKYCPFYDTCERKEKGEYRWCLSSNLRKETNK